MGERIEVKSGNKMDKEKIISEASRLRLLGWKTKRNDSRTARQYFEQAEDLILPLKLWGDLHDIYLGLTQIYSELRQWEEAIRYSDEAEKAATLTGNELFIAHA